ncbi:MAG: DUF2909 domain-containing protein [Rubrivivax sp.]
MKALIVIVLVCILGVLASAGVLMLKKGRDPGASPHAMARALAWRVGLSVALFLFILLAWSLGWVRPTGIPVSA